MMQLDSWAAAAVAMIALRHQQLPGQVTPVEAD